MWINLLQIFSMVSKKVGNRFIPTYVPNNLPWYKRDGLMPWYDKGKCCSFLENTDEHFETLKIVNFDIINSNGQIDYKKLREYQICDHHEIMNFPPEIREQIMSSMFRVYGPDMFVAKETAVEHFNKPIKNIGRAKFIKKLKDEHYKKTS